MTFRLESQGKWPRCPTTIPRLSLCATLVAASVIAVSASSAQQAPSLVGIWILTGADKQLADGTVLPDYGPKPHGQVIFTSDGYYSVQIYRAERMKCASSDKSKGTPEEYREATLGMSDHFGRYSVDLVNHTITFHIDRSSYPNIDDTSPVRPYELKGDVLSWRVEARPDGSVPITTMRRAK